MQFTPHNVPGDAEPLPNNLKGKTPVELRRLLLTLVSHAVMIQLSVIELQNKDDRVKEVQKSPYYAHRIDPASAAARNIGEIRIQTVRILKNGKQAYDKILDRIVAVDERLRSFPCYDVKEVEAYTVRIEECMHVMKGRFDLETAVPDEDDGSVDEEAAGAREVEEEGRIMTVGQLKEKADGLKTLIDELRERVDELREELLEGRSRLEDFLTRRREARATRNKEAIPKLTIRIKNLSDRLEEAGEKLKVLYGLHSEREGEIAKDMRNNLRELRIVRDEYKQALQENRQWILRTESLTDDLARQVGEIISRPGPIPTILNEIEPEYEDLKPIVDQAMQAELRECELPMKELLREGMVQKLEEQDKVIYPQMFRLMRPALAIIHTLGKDLQSGGRARTEQ